VSRSTEIKKLDAALSKYVRKKYADKQGRVKCFTCGVSKSVEDMHCGHFMSRSAYSTRWLFNPEENITNVMPQCPRCNLYDSNQNYIFSRRLDEVFGEGTADKVYTMSKQTRKYTIVEIVAMRKKFESLLNDL
jgi:hypothetical protein